MKRRLIAQLFTILLSCCCSAMAVENSWSINTENSSVNFQIKHVMVMTVKGEFTNFSGTVIYDGRNLQDAVVNAEIATNSIDTGVPKRDLHLKNNDFLDIIHYPTIYFKSKKIELEQSGTFKILGVLSMHGILKPVTLIAQPLKKGTDSSGKTKLTTTATATINRKDFGISMGWMDQSGTAIADKLKVILNIELVKAG